MVDCKADSEELKEQWRWQVALYHALTCRIKPVTKNCSFFISGWKWMAHELQAICKQSGQTSRLQDTLNQTEKLEA